ncbi:hypothetical protein [Sphingobium sp. CCH11-B1]|uniref:hypothetical protein n=1 Tax=Sphingobium sp. CCH11-B1 TaxID=1768781 RepID=UPI000B1B4346|nr:hypothetical protein [Sphingobium sp. CCH11-B1]
MTVIIRTNTDVTDPNAPIYVRDQLLADSNDGVRFLFDYGRPYSWPNQDDPINGDGARDISNHANAAWTITSGSPDFDPEDGGMDFSTVTTQPANLVVPAASFAADIFADQLFLVAMYLKLPSAAQWPADASGYRYFMCGTLGSSSVVTSGEADIVSIGMWTNGSTHYLVAHRQKNGTVVDTLFIDMAGQFEAVGQLGFWRSATQQGLRWKSAAGTVLYTLSASTKNVTNFSSKTLQVGLPNTFWGLSDAGHRASSHYRMFRHFGENLARSGRDPVTVLDADYARNIGRFA